MVSIASILIKCFVVCLIGWVALALFYGSLNAKRERQFWKNVDATIPANEQEVFYLVPKLATIPFFEKKKFSAICTTGHRIAIKQTYTFTSKVASVLDYLLLDTLERMEIYNPQNKLIYSSFIDAKVMPAPTKAAYQKSFYELTPSDSSEGVSVGFNIVFPADTQISVDDINSIASCLVANNLVNAYITNLNDPSINESNGYELNVNDGYASKIADPIRIQHGITSLTLLSS